MKQIKTFVLLAFGMVILLTGCEEDDAWPDDYGNRDTLVINNTEEAIVIEYQETEAEIGIIPLSYNHKDTIQAHGQKNIDLYFNSRGNGHVTAIQGDWKRTFTLPVENPVLSVDPSDLD
jgi:hypothetical protein